MPSVPREGGEPRSRALLRVAIADATLAPSTHNTQPWRFKLKSDHVELRADLGRHLRAIDPDARQLVMSCGAALYNLRVSLRAAGRRELVETLPDPDEPALLARVRVGEPVVATDDDAALAAAIPQRRTVRQEFARRPVPPAAMDELGLACAREGAWLERILAPGKRALADAVADADTRQLGRRAVRRELARWLVPTWRDRRDGIPFEKKEYGSTRPGALTTRLRARLGVTFGRVEQERIAGAPAIVVLGTDRDDPAAWLTCGQALEALLLRATLLGLSASYLNQVVEEPDLRARVTALVGGRGYPQLILRLGHGPTEVPAPRRPLREVLSE